MYKFTLIICAYHSCCFKCWIDFCDLLFREGSQNKGYYDDDDILEFLFPLHVAHPSTTHHASK